MPEQEPLQLARPDSHGPATTPPPKRPESELDGLLQVLQQRQEPVPEAAEAATPRPDPVQTLRELMVTTLIPTFVELVEKYSPAGMALHMDASNFLEGGREIRFEFEAAGYRTVLTGTVTEDAIAFHETRYTPEVHGKLVSGPMLRLKNLSADTFRDFVCERLAVLLKSAMRRR